MRDGKSEMEGRRSEIGCGRSEVEARMWDVGGQQGRFEIGNRRSKVGIRMLEVSCEKSGHRK